MNAGQIFTLKVSRTTCRSDQWTQQSNSSMTADCTCYTLLLFILKSHPVQWQRSLLLWRNGEQLDTRNGTNLTRHSTFFTNAKKQEKKNCFYQTCWKKKEFQNLTGVNKKSPQMETIIQFWKETQYKQVFTPERLTLTCWVRYHCHYNIIYVLYYKPLHLRLWCRQGWQKYSRITLHLSKRMDAC